MIGVQAAASTLLLDENMPPSPIEGMLERPHPPRIAATNPTLHTLDIAVLTRLIGPLVPLSDCFCVRKDPATFAPLAFLWFVALIILQERHRI
jgi:hypothetical protein